MQRAPHIRQVSLATEHALAFALDLRRLHNGQLDAQRLQQDIAGEDITVLGETLVNDVPRIIEHAKMSGQTPPAAITADESEIILDLIASYENSRRHTDNLSDDFPIAPGDRGMLSVIVLSVDERNKAGSYTFANGKTWQTTSHITMRAVEYGAPEEQQSALAIWYATSGRRTLAPFYESMDRRLPLTIMATARPAESYVDRRGIRRTTNKTRVRRLNALATKLARVRIASAKQIAAADKKLAKSRQ